MSDNTSAGGFPDQPSQASPPWQGSPQTPYQPYPGAPTNDPAPRTAAYGAPAAPPYGAPPAPAYAAPPTPAPAYGTPPAPAPRAPGYAPPAYGAAPTYFATPGSPYQGHAAPAPQGYPVPASPLPPAPRPTSGLAVTAFISGIIGVFFGIFGIGIAAAIVAIVTGHMALGRLRADPALAGRGLAIAGLIMGYVVTAFAALFLVGFLFLFGIAWFA
ncbi:hypothetical protein JOD62_002800 [Microbacterium keratanolyticum]|uniref:DUF4190 domain-containing protein n=1 Tax=Microbacterium keratanolyticum TaxID=67574 RepID=A0A9W6M9H5_9MICO|nr:DUF4190 domain-containing protein [Microbacterium keratanolyticum]MBM7470252.1 hypothetical protein [Microbacterium keratanolyticum]GLK02331.1 hypothetical protein GCM10017596_20460 [Microbacterium keratanolyticum]